MNLAWETRARVLFEGDAHVMEDACGFKGPNAWVIDGATPLLEPLGLPASSDPQWLAQALTMILAGPGTDLVRTGVRARLASALAAVDAAAMPLVGAERVRFPSAAISVAQLNADGVEVASLADCSVVVRTAGGAIHLVRSGDANAAVDAALAAPAQEPPAAGPEQARPPVDPAERRRLLIHDRQLRNTQGRLWVARREPEAADHAHVVQLDRPELMVMATDGAWRAVDLGLVSGPEEFLERTESTLGALGLMHELRARQAEIGEVADDACVLTLAPATP
ncbi:hypothetical protein [Arthrobacter sp. A2-55]|uniref:hypothetical protein n=1 Tax=Arthrobacter sp. A2-55 TaxID=2897337 RepID=UPI0021CD958D|nr:hypothetical protein [Arthrobacter sp. A2-55]MCU6482666.1 hypothetical protein [Arthrobacter sp. A2-55]